MFNKKTIFYITYAILLFVFVSNYNVVIDLGIYVFGLFGSFFVGLSMAFIINVLMNGIEKLIISHSKCKEITPRIRVISLVITLITIFGGILIILLLVIPQLKDAFMSVFDLWPSFFESANLYFNTLTERYNLDYFTALNINWSNIFKGLTDYIQTGSGRIFAATSSIFGSVVNLGFGFVFAIYVLLQKEQLILNFRKVMIAYLPDKFVKSSFEVLSISNRIFSGFVVGQCTEAAIIGFMTLVMMLFFKMPYPLVITMLITVTAVIPIVGAFLGTAVGAFLIMVIDFWLAIWFVIGIIIIQQIDSNIFYPKIVGSKIGLPGIWVLLGVTVGGSVAGILGMLIGVPLTSVIYAIVKKDVYRKLSLQNAKYE